MNYTNLRIEVTQHHIDHGKRSNGAACPIALAIRERFPGRNVIVESQEVYATDRDGYDVLLRLPSTAETFIANFDGYAPEEFIKPFTLWLEVPESFLPPPDSGATQVFFS